MRVFFFFSNLFTHFFCFCLFWVTNEWTSRSLRDNKKKTTITGSTNWAGRDVPICCCLMNKSECVLRFFFRFVMRMGAAIFSLDNVWFFVLVLFCFTICPLTSKAKWCRRLEPCPLAAPLRVPLARKRNRLNEQRKEKKQNKHKHKQNKRTKWTMVICISLKRGEKKTKGRQISIVFYKEIFK